MKTYILIVIIVTLSIVLGILIRPFVFPDEAQTASPQLPVKELEEAKRSLEYTQQVRDLRLKVEQASVALLEERIKLGYEYLNLGGSYEQDLNQLEQAVKCYDKYLDLVPETDPHRPQVLQRKEECLKRIKDKS